MGIKENVTKRSKITFWKFLGEIRTKRDISPYEYFYESGKKVFLLSENFKNYILSTSVIVKNQTEIPNKFGLMTREEIISRIYLFMKGSQRGKIIFMGCYLCVDGIIRVVSLEKVRKDMWFVNCSSLAVCLDCLDITFRKKKTKK